MDPWNLISWIGWIHPLMTIEHNSRYRWRFCNYPHMVPGWVLDYIYIYIYIARNLQYQKNRTIWLIEFPPTFHVCFLLGPATPCFEPTFRRSFLEADLVLCNYELLRSMAYIQRRAHLAHLVCPDQVPLSEGGVERVEVIHIWWKKGNNMGKCHGKWQLNGRDDEKPSDWLLHVNINLHEDDDFCGDVNHADGWYGVKTTGWINHDNIIVILRDGAIENCFNKWMFFVFLTMAHSSLLCSW